MTLHCTLVRGPTPAAPVPRSNSLLSPRPGVPASCCSKPWSGTTARGNCQYQVFRCPTSFWAPRRWSTGPSSLTGPEKGLQRSATEGPRRCWSPYTAVRPQGQWCPCGAARTGSAAAARKSPFRMLPCRASTPGWTSRTRLSPSPIWIASTGPSWMESGWRRLRFRRAHSSAAGIRRCP